MERMAMNRIREILRLRWQVGQSVRRTAASVGVSRSVVSKTTSRASKTGLDWESAEALDDDALRQRLYGKTVAAKATRAEPDPVAMHVELKRPGVTLELLHIEYKEANPDGYQYTAFCDRYRRWKKRRPVSMRLTHVAGECTFVDYSGKKLHYTDETTGETVYVEMFVGVLGASSLTYVEATRTQTLPDWIGSNQRMYRFFGGVSRAQVPDQLRSAVNKPGWVEPGVNRTYEALARHYNTSVFPARPRKPKDKAKAEVGVQVAQRWILACMRNETYFSLAELNARVRELNDILNRRAMTGYDGRSRLDLFNEIERAALLPLPQGDYEYAEWGQAKVHLDYHVQVCGHYYSVPFTLVHERVETRLTATTLELLHKHQVVAVHVRSAAKYGHTTRIEHMPPNHRAWSEMDPAGVQEWAADVGPMTEAMVTRIFESRAIQQQALRSALGLRRVGLKYGATKTERACGIALRYGASSYKPVERILRHGGEEENTSASPAPIAHENVRGPDSFN
jgi:transposase